MNNSTNSEKFFGWRFLDWDDERRSGWLPGVDYEVAQLEWFRDAADGASSGSQNQQWAFFALLAVPRISNLRVLNTLDSSTPAASTTISFIIDRLPTHF